MSPSQPDDKLNALLGPHSEFEGKLSFEGRVRIDGTFRGEIFSDGVLMIGETARLQAEVSVGTVIVSGELRGNVTASELVELRAPSRMYGNIRTPSLVIERGVVFEGACKMKDED